MNYKLIIILLLIFLYSCADINNPKINSSVFTKSNFSNRGFTLIYNESLFNSKIISRKMNDRDLLIFQKNLKKDSSVKILNPVNNKSIIALVGKNSIYPNFYNSVVSKRISEELELTADDPYIIISEIKDNSAFIAKKAKIFEVEKNVADKAPVDNITINNLNESKNKSNKKKINKKFKYLIKIADFYFENTAKLMIIRVNNETSLKNVKISKISENKFRVYLGPYSNLKSLQNDYNSVEKLNFENIEILKND